MVKQTLETKGKPKITGVTKYMTNKSVKPKPESVVHSDSDQVEATGVAKYLDVHEIDATDVDSVGTTVADEIDATPNTIEKERSTSRKRKAAPKKRASSTRKKASTAVS
jgi:hypothetical protein